MRYGNNNGIAKGIGAVLLAGVLAAGVCCMGFASRGDDGKWFRNSNLSTWHWKDKADEKVPDDKPTGENMSSFELDIANIEGGAIQFLSAELPVAAYEANGVSARAQAAFNITAEIYPVTAENRKVDWRLLWADDDSEVTTHASLTIPLDGSLTVTLVVTEAFPSRNMKLVCTSRDSGASGTALVKCEGIPTDININGSKTISNCRWGNTNTYAVDLSNAINYVGEAQYDKLTVKSVTLYGSIYYYAEYFIPDYFGTISKAEGKSPSWATDPTVTPLSEKYPNALTATVSGHNLVLNMSAYPSRTAEDYNVGTSKNGRSGTTFFGVTEPPRDAYADVVLQVGSLEKTVRVNFVVGVTGVGLNDLVF